MRVYVDSVLVPNSKAAKDVIENCARVERELGACDEIIIKLHNEIRNILGLPNKVFGIFETTDTGERHILLFSHKPDGKVHKVCKDENNKMMYIEVENCD